MAVSTEWHAFRQSLKGGEGLHGGGEIQARTRRRQMDEGERSRGAMWAKRPWPLHQLYSEVAPKAATLSAWLYEVFSTGSGDAIIMS